MGDFYKPCNFTNIQGYPHDLPTESTISKLPLFQGNNVINVESHIKNFNFFIQRYTHATTYNHKDVRMKLFVVSLEDDALDWFQDKASNSFDSLRSLLDAFRDKYGDKREGKYLVKEFITIKKRKNETVEEFNQIFNKLLRDMTQDYEPPDKTILEQYLEAYLVDTQYEIRRVNPNTLAISQSTVEELEKDKKASRKAKIPGFERVQIKSKGKEVEVEESETVKEFTRFMKEMKIEHDR